MKRRRSPSNSDPDVLPPVVPVNSSASASATAPQLGAPVSWTPHNLLIPYILLAVSLQRAHGYLIEAYLKSLGFFGVDRSVLYRTLRHLEHDGLVVSAWEPGASGPAR